MPLLPRQGPPARGAGLRPGAHLAQLAGTDCADPPPVQPLSGGTWRRVADLDVAASESASAGLDGAVYTAGGYGHLQRMQRYDPAADSYQDLPALYNQAGVFVFPSHVEAFGLTCVEAMSCGRPVVATCLASGPELVEDGVSGLLADPRDPHDLASKVCIMLDDPNLAGRMGIAARQHVLERFDLQNLGSKNLAFYRSLI